MTIRSTASIFLSCLLVSACTASTTNTTGSLSSTTGTTPDALSSTTGTTPDALFFTPNAQSHTVQKNGVEQTETLFSLTVGKESRDVLQLGIEQTDQPGTLKRLDPSALKNTNILALYEYYFAGGGFQIVVRKISPMAITIEKRLTSEGSEEEAGGCSPQSTLLKTYALLGGAQVTLDDAHLEAEAQPVVACQW